MMKTIHGAIRQLFSHLFYYFGSLLGFLHGQREEVQQRRVVLWMAKRLLSLSAIQTHSYSIPTVRAKFVSAQCSRRPSAASMRIIFRLDLACTSFSMFYWF